MSVVKDPRLRNWLFIGSSKDAKNLAWLKRNHIRYIINCTNSVDSGGVPNYHEKSEPLSFEYCRLPISDNDSELLKHHYEKGWAFFHRCLVREDGACLVHCKLGISRSASCVMSFLIKFMRMGFSESLNLLIASRPEVSPNSDFRQQLRELAEHLEQHPNEYWKLPFNDDNESLLFSGRCVDVWAKMNPRRISPALSPSSTKIIGPMLPPKTCLPKSAEQEFLSNSLNNGVGGTVVVCPAVKRRKLDHAFPSSTDNVDSVLSESPPLSQ